MSRPLADRAEYPHRFAFAIQVARDRIAPATASAMPHQLEEFAAVGIDGVAPKPVNAANLLRMIDQAVRDTTA